MTARAYERSEADERAVWAAAKPMREKARPAECDRRPGCWVELGPPGCSVNNTAPHCTGCLGRILGPLGKGGAQRWQPHA
jgi:hypothetical protein